MFQSEKWLVLSWTTSAVTIVSIVHNKAAAFTAVAAVSLTDGVIGAGCCRLLDTANLEYVQGVAQP